MPYIRIIPPDEATGPLKAEYEAAVKRAGRVSRIVSLQCHNPLVLKSSIRFYRDVMFGPSPLSRAQREMLAVVVSKVNDCFY